MANKLAPIIKYGLSDDTLNAIVNAVKSDEGELYCK